MIGIADLRLLHNLFLFPIFVVAVAAVFGSRLRSLLLSLSHGNAAAHCIIHWIVDIYDCSYVFLVHQDQMILNPGVNV